MAFSLERYNRVLSEIREARDAFYQQNREAQEARRFLAGHHWPDEELLAMRSEQRPALVFNQYGQLVHLISGNEISSRFEPHFLPRTPEDQGGNDVFNEMTRYYRNECDAAHEESLSFRDCINEGVGVTETFFDDTEDPNGRVKTVRVNPDEVLWDPNSSRKNMLDARYIIRGKWLDQDQFLNKWPDKAEMFFNTMAKSPHSSAFNLDEPTHIVDVNRAWMYKSNQSVYEGKTKRILIIERQYWEHEKGYIVQDPQTGVLQFLEEEEAQQLQIQSIQQGIQIPIMRKTEKRYKREFWAGPILLEEGDNPIPMFTYSFMSGFQDASEDFITYYGLFRPGKDPQLWANKMLSQIVHIIGTNPKGSVHIEVDALQDPNKARKEWSKPDAMIMYQPGGVSGNKMKIHPPPRLPEAAFHMAEYSLTVMQKVFGVNPYSAGLVEDLKRTPASSVNALIRQGLVSLAPLFDSLSLYRKQIGRVYMNFIKNFIQPGVMVRVVGNPTAQFVQYTQDHAFMNFDVVVEEVPTSTTNTTELWSTLTEQGLLPQLIEMGIPVPPTIIDIIPGLPQYIRDEWKKFIEQMMQAQAAPPEGV